MAQIQKLCENPVAMNSSEQIQNTVMFLQRSDGLSKHVDSFMQMLSLLQLKDDSLFVLTPLLSDELRDANFLRYGNFLVVFLLELLGIRLFAFSIYLSCQNRSCAQ